MEKRLKLSANDINIENHYLPDNFTNEIILDQFSPYLTHDKFLDYEEIKILEPNPSGEITLPKKRDFSQKDQDQVFLEIKNVFKNNGTQEDITEIVDRYFYTSKRVGDRERNPVLLRNALRKIQAFLQSNANKLPKVYSASFVFCL